jgi:hypothetical protein
LRNSFGDALQSDALASINAVASQKSLKGIYEAAWKADKRYKEEKLYRERVDAAILATKKEPEKNLAIHPWMVTSTIADDMCTDFMAPLLRGFMTPAGQRGVALSQLWEMQFDWQNCDNHLGYGSRAYGSAKDPPPLVLFNATRVESGCRLIVGFPPLLTDTFSNDRDTKTDFYSYLPDGSEYHTLTLADFDPNYRVTLAEAARISANFPWGVRAARLHSDAETRRNPARFRQGELSLLDGGVNDNSGVASVWDVFNHLSELAELADLAEHPERADPNKKPAPKQDPEQIKRQQTAREIMRELQRRGVYFLEIDSGARPSSGRVSELGTPAQGLETAAYATADESRQWHTDRLQDLFMPRTPVTELEEAIYDSDDRPFGYGYMVDYSFQCNHTNFEAMTAWALPPSQKAMILATFFYEFREWTEIELQTEEFKSWLAGWEKQAVSKEVPWRKPTGERVLEGQVKAKEKAQDVKRQLMPKMGK